MPFPSDDGNSERGQAKRTPRFRDLLIGALLIALIPSVFFFAQLTRPGGLLNLLQFGVGGEENTVPSVAALHPPRHPNYNHDGQYYAQLAVDPFMRDPQTALAMDYAAYRAHRIFLPGLSHLLGAGNPALTLNILATLNFIFLFCLLGAVLLVVKPVTTAQWAGVTGAVLTSGSMDSLRAALTDLPASVFIFVAVMFPLGALRVALLAIAILTRETAVLSALPCVVGRPLLAWRNLLRVAVVLLPMGLLLVYVHAHLSDWGAGPGRIFSGRAFRWRSDLASAGTSFSIHPGIGLSPSCWRRCVWSRRAPISCDTGKPTPHCGGVAWPLSRCSWCWGRACGTALPPRRALCFR